MILSQYLIGPGFVPQRLPQQRAAGTKKSMLIGSHLPPPRHQSWEGTGTSTAPVPPRPWRTRSLFSNPASARGARRSDQSRSATGRRPQWRAEGFWNTGFPGRQALQPPRLDDAPEEGARALLGRRAENLFGRALLVHHAAVEEADLARHLAGEAHLVGGEEHGHALLRQIAHDVQDLRHQFGIQRRGDLVEQQHQRVHGKRTRDGDHKKDCCLLLHQWCWKWI